VIFLKSPIFLPAASSRKQQQRARGCPGLVMTALVKAGDGHTLVAEPPHLPQFTVDWRALPMTVQHIRVMFRFDHGFLKQFPA
jgi:hypothetical protein